MTVQLLGVSSKPGRFSWPAQAWRMGADDYAQAVRSAPRDERNLSDGAVRASWDAELAPAMQISGMAIAEEAMAACLLHDLQRP